ncbi:hypothetical protein FRC07_004179 [Ceratobasidium sp. 392]|nr:hypothetical protein FRC07_004179 [Ceratobasidium sp. 392]
MTTLIVPPSGLSSFPSSTFTNSNSFGSSTASADVTSASNTSEPASEKREAVVVSIIIIALSGAYSYTPSHTPRSLTQIVAVVTILGGVFICYLIRRRRRRKAESVPKPKPRVLQRRRRRPSDFWSADASNPKSGSMSTMERVLATARLEALESPRTPNENAGLLSPDRATRQAELIAAAGLAGGEDVSESRPAHLVLDVGATVSNDIQQPTPAHHPEHSAWDNTAMGQQQRLPPHPNVVRPYIPTPYEPPRTSRRMPPRPLVLARSHRTTESEENIEMNSRSASSPPYSTLSHHRRALSNVTSTTATDPFFLDSLILGSPPSQTSHEASRAQSPARSSILSFSSFPLPPTPQTPLQFDVSQALASLRTPVSPASPSTARTSRPQFEVVVDDPTSPRPFGPGYFMYTPPSRDEVEERLRLQPPPRSLPKAPSLKTVYSNPDESTLRQSISRNNSASSGDVEVQLDGVLNSREEGVSSPALPDSVRTSMLSYFERR